jgi:hypothetical protein
VHVHLTKLSQERHRLEIVRPDGSREGRELETRSFLIHDLAHFAVEQQGGLANGFWGSLAAGVGFDALLVDVADDDPRWRAERLAAQFQSLWGLRDDPSFAERRARYVVDNDVDDAFVDGSMERMRQLWGHWKATPWGGAMTLSWVQPTTRGRRSAP